MLAALAPLPLTIWNEYGDADAAWDGIVAVLWAQQGGLPTQTGVFIEERFRSSPLSIWLLHELVRTGRLGAARVARVMNVASAAAGLLIPLLAWRLLSRLRGRDEGIIAVLLLLTSPVFFRLRCYGLPTLPAFACFIGAVLCFDLAATRPRGRGTLAGCLVLLCLVLLCLALFCLAVLMKVDVVLLAPALVAIAWFGGRGPRWPGPPG